MNIVEARYRLQRCALAAVLLGVAPLAASQGLEPTVTPLADGGYLELGAVFDVSRSIRAQSDSDERRDADAVFGFYAAGAWRRGALFVEGQRGGLDGASLGATVWHDERRRLDLLAAHLSGTIELNLGGDADDGNADEEQRNADLLQRDTLFGSSGFRYREYHGDTLLQATAVMDWSNGNGALLGAHVGRQWQLGNWNLQGILGARWASGTLVDFVYGVDEDEATDRFAAYEGRDTLFGEADLGITRALGRDWVLRSNLRVRQFGDGITDSPLVAADRAVAVEAGVAYVF